VIQPDEIIKKAELLYPKAVAAILRGENDFFPYRLACNLKPPTDHADLIRAVDQLRHKSKATLGYGYSISYQPRRSHQHGQNDFPESIIIESMDDLVRLLRKSAEFRSLMNSVQQIRTALPELDNWVGDNWRRLIPAAADIPGLIEVTRWLKLYPRPGCYPRELPLPISSKLVESYWSLLAAWWDKVLPHETIDYGCDPKNYAQRYGFRWVQSHILLRLLDTELKQTLRLPFTEFSLPPGELRAWLEHPDFLSRVVIVENKINLLTLPQLSKTIALGGLGFGISVLNQVPGLIDAEIFYWGDMDIEGFQILSVLRSILPQTRSWLMDLETLNEFRTLSVPGNGAVIEPPVHLNSAEREAFIYCRDHNLRLEQERIPQTYVLQQAAASFSVGNNRSEQL
jgi:hypothetical protein